MEKVDTLVVDKTGTLTEGKPSVTALVAGRRVRRRRAAAPRGGRRARLRTPAWPSPSSTPPTTAGLPIPDVTDFDSPTGKGVIGTVEGRRVAAGQRRLPERPGHRRRHR